MYQSVLGCLAALALAPAGGFPDEPRPPAKADKPASPAERYQALRKEYENAQKAYSDAMQNAKTEEEQTKVFQEKYPKPGDFARRFLALAQEDPRGPAAFDALAWVVKNAFQAPEAKPALAMLLANGYAAHEKAGELCPTAVIVYAPDTEKFLREVLEKNSRADARGKACFHLAGFLKSKATVAGNLQGKGDAEAPARLEKFLGKEYADQLRGADPAKVTAEAEALYERTAREFADVKSGRGTLGESARAELFEMRNLAVGKVAPDIEGEDIDGKRFKLSDYRGKVVVLDFWGHW